MGVPHVKVMYLFAGKRRHSDIGALLQQLQCSGVITLTLLEFDIERSESHDLSKQGLWDEIRGKLTSGKWFLIVSPPCNTFSRARFQWRRHPGPRPLRNKTWPKGFPWLAKVQAAAVSDANSFIEQCITSCRCVLDAGGWFLFEHPEDLGKVEDEHPGSVWQWEEMADLLSVAQGGCFAIHQCQFGALTPKPTRLLCSFKFSHKLCYHGMPKYDSTGRYLGPLPRKCGHIHKHKLIGKTAAAWNTGPSAAYPPGMCRFIAQVILDAYASFGGGCKNVSSLGPSKFSSKVDVGCNSVSSSKVNVGCNNISSMGSSNFSPVVDPDHLSRDLSPLASSTSVFQVDSDSEHFERLEPIADNKQGQRDSTKAEGFDLTACCNRGRPIWVEWDGKEKEFTDGFGLCSPTRWPPLSRGAHRSENMLGLASSTFKLLENFVITQLPDPRLSAFKLVTGKLANSPFTPDSLQHLRQQWSLQLPDPADALVVDAGQPFFLRGLAQWLEIFDDPDFRCLVEEADSFSVGVRVGVDAPLPRTPQVFPCKEKFRRLDESDFNPIALNYQSAQLSCAELEEKFREEEALGRMFPTRLAILKEQFGEEHVRIASMAAIAKPDGAVRPLHDGTHSVRVNNSIVYQDQLQCPGPAEVASVVREAMESLEAPFAVSADIKAAHRLVKVRKSDWPYLACRADSNSDVVWVNTVGTFGISSAPYWWSKLFALIGRFVGHIMLQSMFWQLVYVDDLHGTFVGERKFIHLWIWVLAFELVGTPFGYHKFKGGVAAEFIGYQLKYDSSQVGISIKRGGWLREWIQKAQQNKFVVVARDFAEFLGRLGFVSQLLTWMKPHLSPLFAWSAAISNSTVGRLPDTVVLTLKFIDAGLDMETYLVSVRRPIEFSGEQFRTDAKCEDNLVVLGGWEVQSGRWFKIDVTPSQAPYFFVGGKGSQWASTSAELMASLAALVAFGWVKDSSLRRSVEFSLSAGTDNRANEFLSSKRSTTKWPLMLINMQLSALLSRSHLSLRLRWRPREENTVADDLTNSVYGQVDLSKQISISFEDLPLSLVNSLWRTKVDFDTKRIAAKSSGARDHNLKRKKTDKSPW